MAIILVLAIPSVASAVTAARYEVAGSPITQVRPLDVVDVFLGNDTLEAGGTINFAMHVNQSADGTVQPVGEWMFATSPITVTPDETGGEHFSCGSGTVGFNVSGDSLKATFTVPADAFGTINITYSGTLFSRALPPASLTVIDADVDDSGDVDVNDLGLLAGAWLSMPGDPNWNELYDLDGDGNIINMADIAFLGQKWLRDLARPSVPQNLTPVIVTDTSVSLTWDASADNIGVAGYNIYRDGSYIASRTFAFYTDLILDPDTAYTYRLTAYDAQNNESARSNSVTKYPFDWQDFGDAPEDGYNYPTTLAQNGARHNFDMLGPPVFLGSVIDVETDGMPAILADGDDSNDQPDEDGITFITSLMPDSNAGIEVNASGTGKLDAWLDFNGDGDWDDPNEQIFASESLVAGTNTLQFYVPSDANEGQSYARFRFSTDGGLDYYSQAPDGEVEDYAVYIGELYDCPCWGDINGCGGSPDGDVDTDDMCGLMMQLWNSGDPNDGWNAPIGTCMTCADLDQDGDLDAIDQNRIMHYTLSCGSPFICPCMTPE